MVAEAKHQRNIVIRILSRIKSYITALLVIVTLTAYSATFISPDFIKFPQFVGMGYPYLLLVDILCAIVLGVLKRKGAIVLAVTVLVGFGFIKDTVQINPLVYADNANYKNMDDSSVNIMSFNVRLLDRYNWIKGKNDTKQQIFDFIKYESPDIVCFQEFYTRYSDSVNNQTIIKDILSTPYVVRDYDADEHWLHTDKGYVIFSRFKIDNRRYIIDDQNNINGITVDADVYGKKVRIFNIHLKSIHLGYDDYDFLDSLDHKNNRKNISGFKNIYQKISGAYSDRCRQASVIDSMIKASPYPVVVCGDFNDPPVSYCYQKVKGGLKDAFCQGGKGFGTTITLKFLKFRIDYILHSPQITSRGFKTYDEYLSDHSAIGCNIKL